MNIPNEMHRALQLIQSGDFAQAKWVLQLVLAQEPNQPDALQMAGLAHFYSGEAARAAELLGRAVELKPDRIDYLFNLGMALAALGRREDAAGAYRKAAALPFDGAGPLTHLARELHNFGCYADALNCSRRAVELSPTDAAALTIYGQNLMATGEFIEAISAIRRALLIRPDDADTHWDLGMLLLREGELLEGYREFEWRLRSPGRLLLRGFLQPQWAGAPLAGKTLLVHAEGGFGDTIQYVRFIPPLRGRALRLIVECQRELIPLFGSLEGVDEIIARGVALPGFDAHVALPSLPSVLKTELKSIPNSAPYLKAPGDYLKRWADRVGVVDGLKVGLVWSGNRNDPTDKRSMELSTLAPLAEVAGVKFFSLQMGEAAKEARPAGMEIVDHTGEIRDFADTGALVAQMDLVISVDTGVAHLAGALGKRVWLLAPFVAAYQWMRDRADSPWYPTMRIFRQPVFDDWGTPVSEVARALREL